MDGTIADRGVTRALRFALAGDADEAGVRRLLRNNPMRGAVSVTFEREPDYFLGNGVAGGTDQTIVAHEDGCLVCMGRCTRRECWVNGRASHVGYLAELRLDAGARRRFAIIRDGYRFFRARNEEEFLFTSIASDNARARRLLESGSRGLPAYEFLGELVTLLIAVPRRLRAPKLRVEPAAVRDLSDVVQLLNEQGHRHQFPAVWTVERLRALAAHGLPPGRIMLAKKDGKLKACGALWDQRGFRQTVVHGYRGVLGLVRPLFNAGLQVLRRPLLPPPGSVLAQAFLSPLAFAAGAEELLPAFAEACFPFAASAGVEWLTLALPAEDVRLKQLQRQFHVRTWPSRLYRVRWPDSSSSEKFFSSAPFLPDVALL